MTTTSSTGTLYVALELGCDKWVLASTTQAAQKPRFRTIAARNLNAFQEEIAKAKARFVARANRRVGRKPETRLGLGDLLLERGEIARRHCAKTWLLGRLRGAGEDPLVAAEFQGDEQRADGDRGGHVLVSVIRG